MTSKKFEPSPLIFPPSNLNETKLKPSATATHDCLMAEKMGTMIHNGQEIWLLALSGVWINV